MTNSNMHSAFGLGKPSQVIEEMPTPRVAAYLFLVDTFGDQFSALSSLARECLIVDVMGMDADERSSYARNIGDGNLASYSELMIAEMAWRYVRGEVRS